MKLVKIKKSKLDNTVKFIYELDDGLITEFSFIDKNDGKHIICASTQTGCNMGCKFCHLTGKHLQKVRNLFDDEIVEIIDDIHLALGLHSIRCFEKTLLVSFMGVGEPLNNIDNVYNSIRLINSLYTSSYKSVRYALATMVPEMGGKVLENLLKFSRDCAENGYDLKIHYSLHSVLTEDRKELMPLALDHETVIPLLKYINKFHGTKIELHYTLIKDVNDSDDDMGDLIIYELPVKFLKLAERDNFKGTSREEYIERIKPEFDEFNIISEFYEPPGGDVGASCGQICVEEYTL